MPLFPSIKKTPPSYSGRASGFQTLISLLNGVWFIFKLLLSTILVAMPIALLVDRPERSFDPASIGLCVFLVVIAALPWVKFKASRRNLGWGGIAFSFVIAFLAVRMASGAIAFPRNCISSRRSAYCELSNLLFTAGGEILAAMPLAIAAASIFWLFAQFSVIER